MAERRQVGNLIKPRPVPAFTAETTATARWIDGTAGGSATDLGYGWYNITGVGNMAYSITEEGLTIAATTATGRGRVMTAPFEATTTKQNINNYGIPVKANTSYTFSYKAKGTNILASTTRAGVILFTTGGVAVTTPTPSYIPAGDSDWTDYSVTFTTGANVAYAVIYPGVFTAGNIMSATFKDFKLDTTVPTTRTTATSRTTASNRVAVRDMGTALQFDGVNDMVTTAYDLPSGQSYTFSGWANRRTNTGNNALCGTDNGANGLIIYLTTGTFDFRPNAGQAATTFAFNPQLNKWFHWAITYDRVTVKLYVNGVPVGSNAYTIDFLNNQNFVIGKFGGGGAFFWPGLLDEQRIYLRALSAQEISDLYLHNIVPRDGLVGEWLFNEASGSTALDTSGNENDGTITGATYTTDVPLKLRTAV